MGRRVTSGVVGGSGLGTINVLSSTITTTTTDGDLTFDPNGAGKVVFAKNAQLASQNDLRFGDADDSNYVAIQAPSVVASDYTWTLPDAPPGVNGYALTSTTSGDLSWAAAGAVLTDNNSDAGTNYLVFTTQTSDFLTASRVATSTRPLSYTPSTGTLVATAASFSGTVQQLYQENVTTVSKSFALSDRDKVIACTNTTAITITVPTNATVAFPIGSRVYVYRKGSGAVNFEAAAGVTINKVGTMIEGEEFYCRKRDTDEWVVVDTSGITQSIVATGGAVADNAGVRQHTYTTASTATQFVTADA